MIHLDALPKGDSAVISKFSGMDATIRRLREIGFYEGGRVRLKAKMFFWGPIVVEVGALSVALRRVEAHCILVTKDSEK